MRNGPAICITKFSSYNQLIINTFFLHVLISEYKSIKRGSYLPKLHLNQILQMPKHYFNRLERLDYLMRKRSSGSSKELAEKLEVSKRTVYEYLEILKSLGAEIEYDNRKKLFITRRVESSILDL